MELEAVSCEDQARAAALEWHRLKAANDTPETLRAFTAGCQRQQTERGADVRGRLLFVQLGQTAEPTERRVRACWAAATVHS